MVWFSLSKRLNQLTFITQLVGDFNSHNVIWNCKHTDTNGSRFEKAIENSNLFLHNEASVTYVNPPREYTSNLDLIFSTLPLNDETWGLDHFPVFIEVNAEATLY